MRIKIVIIFLLIFVGLTTLSFPQNYKTMKTITADYEAVIHLDTTDYQIYRDPQHPPTTIQGISAGENYLLLWDKFTVYVYDLHTYQLLARLKPRYLPAAATEAGGKIYYMTGGKLLLYDTFDHYEIYTVNSVFTSLADFQDFRNSGARRWPRLPQRVNRLTYHNQSVYFIFANQHYLNLNNDIVIEEDINSKKYIFPKNQLPSLPRGRLKRKYLVDQGMRVTATSPSQNSPYLITFLNMFGQKIKQMTLNKPKINEKEFNRIGMLFIFSHSSCLYFYYDLFNENNPFRYKGLLVEYDQISDEFTKIKLPFRNLYSLGRSAYYFTHSNNILYQIAINEDLSVDVLKVEVKNNEKN